MLCVSSVQFTVRINDDYTEKFHPERGLRQGDPLSPFLYILCAKTLTRQAAKMAITNRLLFPKIAPNGDRVGLLQFANDLHLVLRPNDHTLLSLNQLLSVFEEQAGQRINHTKSQSLFSKNAFSRTIRETKDALRIQREVTSFDYLGTSLDLRCNHMNTWLNTIRGVQNRIAGWRGSTLSPAGRKILIQSVTTAIPIYWLGHHIIPGKVLKQINGMNSNFFWSGTNTSQGLHLIARDKITRPTSEGD